MHSGLDTVLSTVIVQYVLTKSAVTIRLQTEDQNDMFSSLYVLNPTPGRSFGYFQNTGWLIIISWATSGIRGGLPVAENRTDMDIGWYNTIVRNFQVTENVVSFGSLATGTDTAKFNF